MLDAEKGIYFKNTIDMPSFRFWPMRNHCARASCRLNVGMVLEVLSVNAASCTYTI